MGFLRDCKTSRKLQQPSSEALLLTAATSDTASGLHFSDQLALITTSPSPCRCTPGIPRFNFKKIAHCLEESNLIYFRPPLCYFGKIEHFFKQYWGGGHNI